MGATVVMQGVWRVDGTVTRADMAALHRAVAASSLAQRVHQPRMWFARRCFVGDARHPASSAAIDAIAHTDIPRWMDDAARAPLDIDRGPMWSLTLAHLDDGSSAISLVCSHLVADGQSAIESVTASLSGIVASKASTPPTLRDDVSDAATLIVGVTRGVLRSLLRGCRYRSVRAELFAALQISTDAPRSYAGQQVTAVLVVSPAQFDNARKGSSRTALLAAVAHSVLARCNISEPLVAIPARDRDGALSSISVHGSDAAAIHSDIRRRTPTGPPGGMPAEILQLMSDARAHRLTDDAGTADGLVSVLPLPDAFVDYRGIPTRGVAVRAVRMHADAHPALSMWASYSRDHVIVSASVAKAVVPVGVNVAGLITDACRAYGMAATPW